MKQKTFAGVLAPKLISDVESFFNFTGFPILGLDAVAFPGGYMVTVNYDPHSRTTNPIELSIIPIGNMDSPISTIECFLEVIRRSAYTKLTVDMLGNVTVIAVGQG